MIQIILILLLSVSCQSYRQSYVASPELVSIHFVDREGGTEAIGNPERLQTYEQVDFLTHQPYQKILRVYNRDESGDIHAYVTTYHPSGQVKQYLEIVNNRAFGSYKEWYPNGNLKVDAKIIEGTADISLASEKSWIFDGCSRAYDEDGQLIAEIIYANGSLEGTSTYYHSNGVVWKTIPYANNEISGELAIYLDSGELLQTQSYAKGIKEGKSVRYWANQLIAAEEWYHQGLLLNATYQSLTGDCLAEIRDGEGTRAVFGKESISELQEYHRGIPQGFVKVYDSGGHLIEVYHVKNGLKHGEELFFYPASNDPQPKLSIPWYEGKIQGIVKTWYDNHVMESQKEMSENNRNGVATAWYRDGQLMLIEEYEQGKLMKGDYYRKGYRQPISQVVNGEGVVTFFDTEGNYIRKTNYSHGKPDL